MPYAYCGSENCSHFKYWSIKDGEHPQKFCTQCGSPMVHACPSCSSRREDMKDKFCPNCGKPYK